MTKTVSGILLILFINVSMNAVISSTDNLLLAKPTFITTS